MLWPRSALGGGQIVARHCGCKFETGLFDTPSMGPASPPIVLPPRTAPRYAFFFAGLQPPSASRHPLHCGLRIPDLRARNHSPLRRSSATCTRNLPYAKVTSPEDPPLRPERHVPNSIATMQRRLVAALATTSHVARSATRNGHQNFDTVRLGGPLKKLEKRVPPRCRGLGSSAWR